MPIALDIKSISLGLGAGFSPILLILLYIMIAGGSHIKAEQEKLASHTADIAYEKKSLIPNAVNDGQKGTEYSVNDHMSDLPKTPTHMPAIEVVQNKGGPLSPAPDKNIVEETEAGLLPIISGIGQTPFTTYKKPFYDDIAKPVIALTINDYGLSQKLSSALLRSLPSEVTLILNPYAIDAEAWQQRARQNGHELWLQLPMENEQYPNFDYGPKTLLSKASLTYNQERLIQVMSATTGYVGIAADTDGIFLKSRSMLQTILRSSFERGLGFFELNPDGPLFIESFALNNSTPYMRNQFRIDGPANKLKEKLSDIVTFTKERSFSVVHIDLQPAYIPVLKEWIEGLESEEVVLAPLSYISIAQNQRPKPLETQDVEEVPVVPVEKDSQ